MSQSTVKAAIRLVAQMAQHIGDRVRRNATELA